MQRSAVYQNMKKQLLCCQHSHANTTNNQLLTLDELIFPVCVCFVSVAQDWLTESARLISKSGHTVEWVTPLGLPIIQPYHRIRNQVVSPMFKHVCVKLNLHLSLSHTHYKGTF